CELKGDARLKGLASVNDVQMAPLALPALAIGDNRLVYTDDSQGERKVRITHEWVERSASQPPQAPAAVVFPPDGGVTPGTDFVFRWQPAQDPDGDKIVDYHFELSDRPDLKWPLSPTFYRLISKTADRGKAQFTMPQSGLLASGQKYYWRVRAKDQHGVWGAWSRSWSFTPEGPAAPIDVTLSVVDGRGILRWKPNPSGQAPAKYRIYGSDEKGFSMSDEPYQAAVGKSKDVPPTRPANFVAEVAATELTVIGPDVTLPNANRCYYRVTAVGD